MSYCRCGLSLRRFNLFHYFLQGESGVRLLTTQYDIDGLGRLNQLTSPDTGTTRYTYDPAGHVLTRTDARGIRANNSYDGLGRLTQIQYRDPSNTVLPPTLQFQYDGTLANAQGRLRQIIDSSGSTAYTYDAAGRILSKTQNLNPISTTNAVPAASQSVSYVYRAGGDLSQITYPSGRIVNYTYDPSTTQLSALNWRANASDTIKPLLDQIEIHPLGRLQSWRWRNPSSSSPTTTYTRVFDEQGRIQQTPLPLLINAGLQIGNQSVTYDAAGRISQIVHSLRPTLTLQTTYTNHDQLNQALQGATIWQYRYDLNGNRSQGSVNAVTTTYSIDSASNRLQSALTQTGSTTQTQSFSYDAIGNLTGDGQRGYSYDARGRFTQSTFNSSPPLITNYDLNALGQRVRKRGPASVTNSSLATLFVYNEAGQLLGEYDANANPLNEYVYANGELVALFKGAASQTNLIGQIYTDHLGTPRAVVRQASATQAAALLWQWEGEPFGRDAANENPQGQGLFSFNLRFPGQYFDKESNTHYNYFRDYNPQIGRYTTSDPIGLTGGINTYTYVENDPLRKVDPLGLMGNGANGGIGGTGVIPDRPLPYDPNYTACSQYPGNSCEGKTLNKLCKTFGKDTNSNCARKCLQMSLPPGKGDDPPLSWYVPQHPICWYECGWPAGWR